MAGTFCEAYYIYETLQSKPIISLLIVDMDV